MKKIICKNHQSPWFDKGHVTQVVNENSTHYKVVAPKMKSTKRGHCGFFMVSKSNWKETV